MAARVRLMKMLHRKFPSLRGYRPIPDECHKLLCDVEAGFGSMQASDIVPSNIQASDDISSLIIPAQFVHFLVGSSKQNFAIHKDLACSQSPFFRSIFEQSKVKTLILDSTDPELFDLFFHLIYTNEIKEYRCTEGSLNLKERLERDTPSNEQVVDLWLLAESLQAPALQNRIMDFIVAKFTRGGPHSFDLWPFEHIYNQTQNGCMLRYFCVDSILMSYLQGGWFSKSSNGIPTELVFALVAAQQALLMGGPGPFYSSSRTYHVDCSTM